MNLPQRGDDSPEDTSQSPKLSPKASEALSRQRAEIEKIKNFGVASQKMQEIHNEVFSERKGREDK